MLAAMIGLGVGIDYALFVVTRHRENLHDGHSVHDAAGRANATAGQAVLFAGVTVVIAILRPAGARASRPSPPWAGPAPSSSLVCGAAWPSPCCPPSSGWPARASTGCACPPPAPPRRPGADARQTASGRWAAPRRRAPLALRARQPRAAARPGRAGARLRIGFADDGNLADRDHPAAGLRPADRGLRRRLQRPAATSSSTVRGSDATRRRSPTCEPALRRSEAGHRRRCPAGRERGRRHRRHLGHADHVAPGRGHRPSWSTGSATSVVPAAIDGTGAEAYVGRRHARPCGDLSGQLAGPPALVHRRRRAGVLPAAGGRVPLDPGAGSRRRS